MLRELPTLSGHITQDPACPKPARVHSACIWTESAGRFDTSWPGCLGLVHEWNPSGLDIPMQCFLAVSIPHRVPRPDRMWLMPTACPWVGLCRACDMRSSRHTEVARARFVLDVSGRRRRRRSPIGGKRKLDLVGLRWDQRRPSVQASFVVELLTPGPLHSCRDNVSQLSVSAFTVRTIPTCSSTEEKEYNMPYDT